MDLSTGKKYAKKIPPVPGQRVFRTKDMEEAEKIQNQKETEEKQQEQPKAEQQQHLRYRNDKSIVKTFHDLVVVSEKKDK